MICNIAWLCKSILYFEQHTAVILFSCFIVWLQDYPQRQKPLLPHKSGSKTSRQEGVQSIKENQKVLGLFKYQPLGFGIHFPMK